MFFKHAQSKTVIEKFRLESPEIIIINKKDIAAVVQ